MTEETTKDIKGKRKPNNKDYSPMKKDSHYFYGVGKRKSSIATIRLYENGKGEILINNKPVDEYFFGEHISGVKAPLKMANALKLFDVSAVINGGGVSSQADALRHGISRALLDYDPELRSALKKAGFLTRDSRVKERKKFGLKRARRAPQWAKR